MKHLITVSLILLLPVSATFAQKTFEECNSLWKQMSEMAKCQMLANETKEKEIASIIKSIKTTFKLKEQIKNAITAQNNWAKYVESECRARMNPLAAGSSNAAIYQYCRHIKITNRLKELKSFHYCNDNGCPERNE